MEYRSFNNPGDKASIRSLFTNVFSDSEDEKEGVLLGRLADDLIDITASRDLYGFVLTDSTQVIGCIFFSRLTFESTSNVFILAPVAIHTDYQGQGLGQKLIRFGLNALKNDRVRFVITYGDPQFYSKVGFNPISSEDIRAPFDLSQPEGWLGQSLCGETIAKISGGSSCVEALKNPVFW